jgi:histidinol-phosphate aminotransferase
MRSVVRAVNAYPDDDCHELRHALAAYHAVPHGQVLVTAGSTELLGLLCRTMLGPGLNAVTSERSFIVYSMAVRATGAQLIQAPMRNDTFDLGAILDAVDERTRLILLANPNNPTGTVLDALSIDRFLAHVPGNVVVVLDEAYYEFAAHYAEHQQIEYSHSLDYLRKGASVVVLRTFSKAHGLAGLRVGYGLGPEELLAYCARMRNTFSVSSVAQAAALAALGDKDHITRTVSNNAAQMPILRERLAELGYSVLPTAANFVHCDLGEDASIVARRLQNEGVSVRPLGVWGAPSSIRVSVGTPEENRFFLEAICRLAPSPHRTGVRDGD